ncbi:hypothetical protein I312_102744 [Cryptococcus bacillisporus CA1280]|uniref:uncharacterized protein n=1 Tax=Cryptococcus bacillisporus CA1280 TaxID=1296109 RepID=UPI003368907D
MFWDPLFTALSKVVGAPTDQLKLIFSLLVAFPLGSIFVRLPSAHPNVAHLFSIAISTVFLAPLLGLGEGMLHMLFSSLGTYVIVNSMRGKSMPWVVFAFVMGHLLFNLVAFLGYCFFFPSVLVGPSFDYATYDALIHKRLYSSPPPGSSPEQAKATKRRIPYGRKRVAYLHLVIGLFFLGVYALYGDKYSYENVLNPIWTGWGWTRKLGFVQLAGLLARTKYYAVWSLSEGACILTGIGFNGYDHKTGRTLWNRVRNINIKGIETAESFKILFDSWNCRTNVWLRDVVYKRVTKKGKKPGFKESMATFLTSAFWHGISPGYYPPFLLLDFKDSIGAWNRMYWYGHVAIIISMCFMSFGGRKALKRGLDKRKSRIPPSVKVSPPSPPIDHTPPPPPEDEMDSTDLRWVKHDLDNPEDQDSGEGVAMGVAIRDHGFLDKWIEGEETPGSTPGGTPKYEKDDPLQE